MPFPIILEAGSKDSASEKPRDRRSPADPYSDIPVIEVFFAKSLAQESAEGLDERWQVVADGVPDDGRA